MSLTNFNYNGKVIAQRDDGFINLTQMCKANKKLLANWSNLKGTKKYIEEMLTDPVIGITITDVIEVNQGGSPELQGTWGHPELAIHLAQWISPKFHRWCNAHIFNLMTSGQTSIDIDPIEEMKLKIELAKLEKEKEQAIAQAKQSDYALAQFRHTIVSTCPEPVQQKILGYELVKVVEEKEIIVDKRTNERYEGVGIGYIKERYGFKTNKQAWAYLESIGLGKDSEHWKGELSAVYHKKLDRSLLDYIDEVYYQSDRQMWLGE